MASQMERTNKLGKRFIENAIVSEKVVGTDSLQFRNPQFQADPTIIPGALGPFLETPYTGAVLAPPPAVFLAATRGIFDRALKSSAYRTKSFWTRMASVVLSRRPRASPCVIRL